MKINYLSGLLLAILFSLNTIANAQLKILSGVEKGTYNSMAQDIKKICGDYIKVDTIHDKVDVKNDLGEVISSKDTVEYETTKSDFINVMTSGGSVDNYRQLMKATYNSIDVTFLQYDVLLYEELKRMKAGQPKEADLKMLLPLGQEEIHLITRNDEYIERLKDLKGLRVGIGTKQTGTQVTALFIQEITGIAWINVEYDLETCFKKLLSDDIQAFFFVGAMPVKRFSELASLLKYEIRLVPVRDEALDAYYVKTKIPANTYSWSKEDVDTYAVKYGLVTTTKGETKEKKDMKYKLVSDIKNNINKLVQTGHPAWQKVDFDFEGIDWDIHDVSKEIFKL